MTRGSLVAFNFLRPGFTGVFATVGGVITYTLQWKQFLADSKFGYEFKGAGLDVLLGHEIGHTPVAGRAFGYRPVTSDSDADEFNAVRYLENPYRRYLGIPLRTHYSGIKIPDPLITEK